jgi:transketolase
MPSQELFMQQSKEYREQILPASCRKRVSIEAGTTYGWERFVGAEGLSIGMDHFGASAPYKVLQEKFGFTPDAVIGKIISHWGEK